MICYQHDSDEQYELPIELQLVNSRATEIRNPRTVVAEALGYGIGESVVTDYGGVAGDLLDGFANTEEDQQCEDECHGSFLLSLICGTCFNDATTNVTKRKKERGRSPSL